jgi:hypothetical protein
MRPRGSQRWYDARRGAARQAHRGVAGHAGAGVEDSGSLNLKPEHTMRRVMFAALLAGLTASLGAQSTSDPDQKVQGSSTLPAGWQTRLDRANARVEDVKFVRMGDGYHATMGPAAIFYNPKDMASGNYTARVTMTQTKAPTHPEAYGLIVGGRNLDKPNQEYLYFIVRQDGKYSVKHRAGAEVHTIVDWTEHAAVNKADAAGKATNTLAIRSTPDSILYMVNGRTVHAQDRTHAGREATNGIVGLRVNHNLDVHISDFGVLVSGNSSPVRKDGQ